MYHLCAFGSLHQLAIVMQGKTTRMHFTNVVLLSTAGQRAGADTATPNGRACELTTRSGRTAGKGDSKLTLTHKQTVIVLTLVCRPSLSFTTLLPPFSVVVHHRIFPLPLGELFSYIIIVLMAMEGNMGEKGLCHMS